MFSKSLFYAILFRVFLIVITSFAFVTALSHLYREFFITLVGIGALIIFQVYLLSRYLNRLNRKLALFFNSVRNEDSVLKYSSNHEGWLHKSLYASLDELNMTIGEMRRQNARQNLFLNNLVEHVGVGLIFYNEQGEVGTFNNAARDLLHMQKFKRINEIAAIHPELYENIQNLSPGEQRLVRVVSKHNILFISLKQMIFISGEETIKLLSLQNIRTELEHRELDTWQKLIRVMSHEISNSISPINSLANTTKKYFARKGSASREGAPEIDDAFLLKTIDNLDTIETAGKRLIDFVGKYRSLTALPEPRFEIISIEAMFGKLQTLLADETKSNDIKLAINISPGNMEVKADPVLLEQLMINLIKNAIQALGNVQDGLIRISANLNDNGRIVIRVEDNGCGIPSDSLEEIFIPFYTTKSTGSGIGLSLSRQIMRLHNGTISVRSIPNEHTVFTLVF